MSKFAHFSLNRHGRDFAVGDIHGHFSRLQATLDQQGFNPAVDRLFSVGDLVDRGPQSEQCLEWLNQPWFFAVQGNHEALAIQVVENVPLDHGMYRASGGGWFLDSSREKQRLYATCFAQLPIALEVETPAGLIGLVHADCPFPSWRRLRDYLQNHLPEERFTDEGCQWSRARLKRNDLSGVRDVRAVIVGHTPLRRPKRLGNVWHIDTAGWSEGYFSLMELSTLSLLNPSMASSQT
ncbi:MAG: metallophosphoesterase [Pseudomonas sp.]|uniref:metallophosphoesterase n=1 Tax=Pseudomonas abieticivorans TaxID=2931382 RepID=UPI0020C16595|nr:metallophosphoesterase [Pseudomonas sp. PIA16]MDE1164787.1 metallophosphoesterase [Pseudomonas sp.]